MIRQIIEYKKNSDREKLLFNLNKALDKLSGDSKHLQVIICDDYPAATLSQRGYLFGVVLKIIEQHTGTPSEDLFEIFKGNFGDPMHVQQLTDIGQYKLTTKTYSTKNMTIFIEKIRNWATEQGLYIPEANAVPDEVYIKLNM